MRRWWAVGVLGLGMLGCATILQPSRQPVAFSTTPAGAEVRINGEALGVTPVALNLDPTRAVTYELVLAGYAPYGPVRFVKESTMCVTGTLSYPCEKFPNAVIVTLRKE